MLKTQSSSKLLFYMYHWQKWKMWYRRYHHHAQVETSSLILQQRPIIRQLSTDQNSSGSPLKKLQQHSGTKHLRTTTWKRKEEPLCLTCIVSSQQSTLNCTKKEFPSSGEFLSQGEGGKDEQIASINLWDSIWRTHFSLTPSRYLQCWDIDMAISEVESTDYH